MNKPVDDELQAYLNEYWVEFDALFDVLLSDTAFYRNRALSANGTDIDRRSFCRTLFAWIEGTVHLFKQYSLAMEKHGPFKYDQPERLRLSNRRIRISAERPDETAPAYESLKTALPFAFEEWARQNFHPDYTFKKGVDGWRSFSLALKIRHRITHPKTSRDLAISDEELDILNTTSVWLLNVIDDLMASCVRTMVKQSRIIRKKWKQTTPSPRI